MTSQGSVVRPLERDDETGFDLFCEENGAISGMAARPTERVTESWGSLDMAPPQRVGGGETQTITRLQIQNGGAKDRRA